MSDFDNFFAWATKEQRSVVTLKGDVPGHEFHGNQYDSGGGGGGDAGSGDHHISQNDLESISDRLQRGVITVDQANVEKVRSQRVLTVTHIPKSVRMSLNQAVKNGELGHKPKDGLKPEVYYHPNFEYMANEVRSSAAIRGINAISGVLAHRQIDNE